MRLVSILNIFAIQLIALVSLLLFASITYAEPKVGVIVPQLREPFKTIFDAVGEGIDRDLRKRSSQLVITKETKPSEIADWYRQKNIDAVIALGVSGRKAALNLPQSTPIVLGALLSDPGSTNPHPGVALTPNPNALFIMLNDLFNKQKKVVVVYNPLKNQWLINLAKRQAANNKVQLVTLEATDLKQAVIMYNRVFNEFRAKDTAIWLLPDPSIIDNKTVFPFIVEKSWNKNFVVFSSALSHVKKGVLFGLFPDNVAHGKQLAKMIINKHSNPNAHGSEILPTSGLQSAINVRVAEHLDINGLRNKLREFDLEF